MTGSAKPYPDEGVQKPVSKLQGFVEKYGPAAGPRLYHALQSRAAYIGANARRRKAIAGLTGEPIRPARSAVRAEVRQLPLLPEAGAGPDAEPGRPAAIGGAALPVLYATDPPG